MDIIIHELLINVQLPAITVKPVYNGHLWDLKKVSTIDRCQLHEGSYFLGAKMAFQVVWVYLIIFYKVFGLDQKIY